MAPTSASWTATFVERESGRDVVPHYPGPQHPTRAPCMRPLNLPFLACSEAPVWVRAPGGCLRILLCRCGYRFQSRNGSDGRRRLRAETSASQLGGRVPLDAPTVVEAVGTWFLLGRVAGRRWYWPGSKDAPILHHDQFHVVNRFAWIGVHVIDPTLATVRARMQELLDYVDRSGAKDRFECGFDTRCAIQDPALVHQAGV